MDTTKCLRQRQSSKIMRLRTLKKNHSNALFCPEAFPQGYVLKGHINRVHKKKDWTAKCLVCDKMFPSSYFLQEHMIFHYGEKLFACSTCGKRFKRHL
ncbi:PR domain zinc finger protein 10 [Orchesella cincta]|uniref:PR domain zinc finger protein 10 n=1 Tax=Orchesella cincta TaxID=48709 RepID=A0A1D2M1W8_ORCCI|nr:PR domain zinc finger protein 10 [Orchesella cincta]